MSLGLELIDHLEKGDQLRRRFRILETQIPDVPGVGPSPGVGIDLGFISESVRLEIGIGIENRHDANFLVLPGRNRRGIVAGEPLHEVKRRRGPGALRPAVHRGDETVLLELGRRIRVGDANRENPVASRGLSGTLHGEHVPEFPVPKLESRLVFFSS